MNIEPGVSTITDILGSQKTNRGIAREILRSLILTKIINRKTGEYYIIDEQVEASPHPRVALAVISSNPLKSKFASHGNFVEI